MNQWDVLYKSSHGSDRAAGFYPTKIYRYVEKNLINLKHHISDTVIVTLQDVCISI